MYKTNKSRATKLSYILPSLFLLSIFTSSAAAVDLPFNPNLYDFLIYVPGGIENPIEGAMRSIGIVLDPDIDIKNASNPVTLNDLETHNILIVGWNCYGKTGGLDPNVLAAGITGRVILSGRDADLHIVNDDKQAAKLFLVQAIDWVLKGGGTGMITLGCTGEFPYLPEFWDVNVPSTSGGEVVNKFTEEGQTSGVYGYLEPNDMCNWGDSYHDIFTIGPNSFFVPFELGGDDGNDIITIACYKTKWPCFYIKKDTNDVNCVSPLISDAEYEFMGSPYNWLYYNIDCNAIGYADTMFS